MPCAVSVASAIRFILSATPIVNLTNSRIGGTERRIYHAEGSGGRVDRRSVSLPHHRARGRTRVCGWPVRGIGLKHDRPAGNYTAVLLLRACSGLCGPGPHVSSAILLLDARKGILGRLWLDSAPCAGLRLIRAAWRGLWRRGGPEPKRNACRLFPERYECESDLSLSASAANPKFRIILAASPVANFGFKAALES